MEDCERPSGIGGGILEVGPRGRPGSEMSSHRLIKTMSSILVEGGVILLTKNTKRIIAHKKHKKELLHICMAEHHKY